MVVDGTDSFRDVTPVHDAEEYVYDAFFIDQDHGWVGFTHPSRADGRMVRTTDGGRSWQPTGSTARVHQSAGSRVWLYFLDHRIGWAVQYAAAAGSWTLSRTIDGGGSWTDWTEEGASAGPIMFQTAEHGWLGGQQWFSGYTQPLYETLDGGQTWNERSVRPPDGATRDDLAYRLPVFHGSRAVVPVTIRDERIEFYGSDDGGRTWSLAATTVVPGGPKAGIAVPSVDIWWTIAADGGPAAVTRDSGRSWASRRRSGLPPMITDLEAKDDHTAWATAYGPNDPAALYETSDGGDTWQRLDDHR